MKREADIVINDLRKRNIQVECATRSLALRDFLTRKKKTGSSVNNRKKELLDQAEQNVNLSKDGVNERHPFKDNSFLQSSLGYIQTGGK